MAPKKKLQQDMNPMELIEDMIDTIKLGITSGESQVKQLETDLDNGRKHLTTLCDDLVKYESALKWLMIND